MRLTNRLLNKLKLLRKIMMPMKKLFLMTFKQNRNPVDLNEFPLDEQLELVAQQPPPPVQVFFQPILN